MESEDEVDRLLALGSERPLHPERCVDEAAFDDAMLLAYRRASLDETQRDAVEAHLVECPYCRDLVAHLPGRARRPRWPAVLGSIAAAAVAVLFLVTPAPREPIGPYTIADVRGQVATHRSEAVAEGRTFRPESQVAIKVEPANGRPAGIVRAFRLEEGVLLPTGAEIESGSAGVFWVKGSGRALFGEVAGRKRLVLLAAEADADLSRIAGRSLASAQALTTETSWLPFFDAEYVTD